MRIPGMNDAYTFSGYVQHTPSSAAPDDAKRKKEDNKLLAKFLPQGRLKTHIGQATSEKELPQPISFDTSSMLDLLKLPGLADFLTT